MYSARGRVRRILCAARIEAWNHSRLFHIAHVLRARHRPRPAHVDLAQRIASIEGEIAIFIGAALDDDHAAIECGDNRLDALGEAQCHMMIASAAPRIAAMKPAPTDWVQARRSARATITAME